MVAESRSAPRLIATPKATRTWWFLALAVCGWLALYGVLLWMYYQPAVKQLTGDEVMYQRWAQALLSGQGVAPHHFIWPPGQAWFLAAIYALAGVHVIAAQLVQGGLLVVCAGLLYRLWRELDTPAAAMVAVALFAFNPSIVANADWLWPEIPHLVCLLAALVLLLPARRHAHWRALAAGAAIGLTLLFKSLLAGFWPLLLLAFLRRGPRWPRFAWWPAVVFMLGLAAVTAPALVHGYRQTGRPIIADSSVFNLYLGLTDVDRGGYVTRRAGSVLSAFVDSGDTPSARNAAFWQRIRALVAERGLGQVVIDQLKTQYFRLFNARTLLLSQFKGPACAGHLGAYSNAALVAPMSIFARAMHLLTLMLAAFGMVAFRRWRQPLALFVLAFFAYQLALFAGLHVMQRYLLPMLPFACGFAGSFVVAVGARWRGDQGSAMSLDRWRLLLGALLALLMLALSVLGPVLDARCA